MRRHAGWAGRFHRSIGTPWVRTLAVLWFAQAVAELAFSFALPFVPLYLLELGVTDVTQAGLWAGGMAGGFALVMALMGPIWGQVADRHGRRLMIQRALFGACLVIGAMGLVQTPEQLFVLRLLQGSVTGVVAAISTVISLIVPRDRLAGALGLMHAAVFAGTAVGPIAGGVVSDLFGYRVAFAATGALFFVSGVLVTLFVAEPSREPGEMTRAASTMGASVRDLLARPELVVVIGLLALLRVASVAPLPVLPLFIQALAGAEAQVATLTGVVLAATGVASTVSAVLIGLLADRFGRRRTLLVCLVAATLVCLPLAGAGSVWWLLVWRVAMGLALGGLVPALQALFSDLTPADRRGMAFGLLATANAIGNGLGPVAGSIIAAGFGVPMVFLATMPLFLLGAWLLTRLPSAAGD